MALACALALCLPGGLWAESISKLPVEQCVWRAGDDLAWAAPQLDESNWKPYSQWKLQLDQQRMWIRCKADLSALRGMKQPELQISLFTAYTVYVQGEMVGHSGDLETVEFSRNYIRSYPVAAGLADAKAEVALRVAWRYPDSLSVGSQIPQFEAYSGEASLLEQRHDAVVLRAFQRLALNIAYYGVIGVIGIALMGLFVFNRGRIDFLLLSLTCFVYSSVRGNELFSAMLASYSAGTSRLILEAANILLVAQPCFYFRLAGRRIPILYWIAFVGQIAYTLARLGEVWVPSQLALGYSFRIVQTSVIGLICYTILCSAPFVAFWPIHKVSHRLRPLVALCLLWGATDFLWFGAELCGSVSQRALEFFLRNRVLLLDLRGFTAMCVTVALLVLLLREQSQVAEERSMLTGEMQAARAIQTMLAPTQFEAIAGLGIEVAFHPMREVGGDFYLCRALGDGRQRVLVGDVSGKGSAAAMTAALLIGAAERREGDSPRELLQHLNLVLCESRVGGFATCICADFLQNGSVLVANAGHLPPYLHAEEVAVAGSLPLGIAAAMDCAETTLQLERGDQLTFLSDGVVEARAASGELFGFQRTAKVSSQSADAIARSAQVFGQDDDITVLTVGFQG